MQDVIKGKAYVLGDNIDTDQIIPARFLKTTTREGLGAHLFAGWRPCILDEPAARGARILVAGRNFGCGSSREHAPRALLQMGIACVVAESFARIFYRNCINTGLLPVECRIEADDGDLLSVDLAKGTIVNHTKGKEWGFTPFPSFIQELMDKGGLMAKIKEEKRCTR